MLSAANKLSVILLNVIMLNVVAPEKGQHEKNISKVKTL